jgi:hypothetical protein
MPAWTAAEIEHIVAGGSGEGEDLGHLVAAGGEALRRKHIRIEFAPELFVFEPRHGPL